MQRSNSGSPKGERDWIFIEEEPEISLHCIMLSASYFSAFG